MQKSWPTRHPRPYVGDKYLLNLHDQSPGVLGRPLKGRHGRQQKLCSRARHMTGISKHWARCLTWRRICCRSIDLLRHHMEVSRQDNRPVKLRSCSPLCSAHIVGRYFHSPYMYRFSQNVPGQNWSSIFSEKISL